MKKHITVLVLLFIATINKAQTTQEPVNKKETKTTQTSGSNEKAINEKGVSVRPSSTTKKGNAAVKETETKEATEEKKTVKPE